MQGAALLRVRHRRLFCSAPPPDVALSAIRALYHRGSGRRKTGPGQPRIVANITGGGGAFFQWLLSMPGASSCLLEGRVPYAKESLVASLAEVGGRTIDGVGFCSASMAARMAAAARDRAIALTPMVSQWPDAIGVASTATIVSHYPRRGEYRVHAAACTGPDAATTTYSHTFVKGARERQAEDAQCALLTLRALAEAVGLEEARELAACGVRLEDTPAANALGEHACGLEAVPEPVAASAANASTPRVLIPMPPGGARDGVGGSREPSQTASASGSAVVFVPHEELLRLAPKPDRSGGGSLGGGGGGGGGVGGGSLGGGGVGGGGIGGGGGAGGGGPTVFAAYREVPLPAEGVLPPGTIFVPYDDDGFGGMLRPVGDGGVPAGVHQRRSECTPNARRVYTGCTPDAYGRRTGGAREAYGRHTEGASGGAREAHRRRAAGVPEARRGRAGGSPNAHGRQTECHLLPV